MAAINSYSALGKDAKDLLGKSFNVGNVSAKAVSSTDNGVKFEVAGSNGGKCKGHVAAEYTKGSLTFNEKWSTSNAVDLSVKAKNVVKNLTVNAGHTYSGAKKSCSVGANYTFCDWAGIKVPLGFDAEGEKKTLSFGADAAASYDGFVAGVSAKAQLPVGAKDASVSLAKLIVKAGYAAPGYSGIVTVEGPQDLAKAKVNFSYHHAVNADTSVAGSMTWNRAKDTVALEAGGSLKLADGGSVKAKAASSGLLSFAYVAKLNGNCTATLSSAVDANKLGDSAKFGVDFGFKF